MDWAMNTDFWHSLVKPFVFSGILQVNGCGSYRTLADKSGATLAY
jgi:hypothetical protein